MHGKERTFFPVCFFEMNLICGSNNSHFLADDNCRSRCCIRKISHMEFGITDLQAYRHHQSAWI